MTAESPIVIALDRAMDARDQKAITSLMVKWLVYDVKVNRNRSGAEIKLFHSVAAKPADFFRKKRLSECKVRHLIL